MVNFYSYRSHSSSVGFPGTSRDLCVQYLFQAINAISIYSGKLQYPDISIQECTNSVDCDTSISSSCLMIMKRIDRLSIDNDALMWEISSLHDIDRCKINHIECGEMPAPTIKRRKWRRRCKIVASVWTSAVYVSFRIFTKIYLYHRAMT